MSKKKILGLGTQFSSLKYDDFKETEFSSAVSLLDYDAVVIDVGFISKAYESCDTFGNKEVFSEYSSEQIQKDFSVKKEQIIELLKQGRNLFLLMGENENRCVLTGEKKYSGTGKNARVTGMVKELDMYSFLPIGIAATHIYGTEMKVCCNSPYSDFLKHTARYAQYASYFTVKGSSISLAYINGTDKQVAAVIPYQKGKIICLPQPYYKDDYVKVEYWRNYGREYLDALFELADRLSVPDEAVSLPDWTNDVFILGEKEEVGKQLQIEKRIDELQAELVEQKQRIEELQKYKLLLTASGTLLEEITKQVLNELGFLILDTERGRSDIIAKYNEISIVAEIKGVSKSAAEKHAAQLEKWVSQYIEDNEVVPKGVLIVNGFCDTPIRERTEDVFPHQMLKYCEARRHALITTTQLLCLYIESYRNPSCKVERINELLACVGKYERYEDVSEYFNGNAYSE